MQKYQQRVVEEKEDLDGKIERLAAFLQTEQAQNLPPEENPRLTRQLRVMREYSGILSERIADFVIVGKDDLKKHSACLREIAEMGCGRQSDAVIIMKARECLGWEVEP